MSAAKSSKVTSSRLQAGDAVRTIRLLSYATLQIVEVGIRMKGIEGSRLVEHFGCRPRGELPHAVGDHVLDGQDRDGAVGLETNEPDAGPIRFPVQQRRRDDLEAEAQIGMDPPERRVSRASACRETPFSQGFFERILPRCDDVEITGAYRAS